MVVSTVTSSGPSRTTASSGDGDEFAAACLERAAYLYRLAREVLRSDADAEEAVQETLALAWRSRRSLRDPSALSTWLTRICLRHCLRLRHRLHLRHEAEVAGRSALEASEPFDDTDLDVDGAVAKLSRQQRAVVVLHYRDGYTLNECAGLMGCRPGSVRRHLSRALATLREDLK